MITTKNSTNQENMGFLIVANWKMHGSRQWSTIYKKQIENFLTHHKAQLVLCPPAVYCTLMQSELYDIGAQDLSQYVANGPYTGEISGTMLKDSGCNYVIIGHSERRNIDDSSIIRAKIEAASKARLKIILCIGENQAERSCGRYISTLENQLLDILAIEDQEFYIAYEPKWSIGSGKAIKTKDLSEISSIINKFCLKQGLQNQKLGILYGGSVSESNARELRDTKQINGLLIGSASLECERIISILESVC
jgi:triosephosphate isomerase